MRAQGSRARPAPFLWLLLALSPPAFGLAPGAATPARAGDARAPASRQQAVDRSTWVDHDGIPGPKPAERERNLYSHQFREAVVEPVSHALDVPDKILWFARLFGAGRDNGAQNVNAFDEVPNSRWFTNRNHVRHLPPQKVRLGCREEPVRPDTNWTIKDVKRGGVNPGFVIEDASERRWLIKLDPPGHARLGSGADIVANRLVHAAGYNVPYDVPVTFRRTNLSIDEDLEKGEEGERPFRSVDLDTLLAYGYSAPDGRYYGQASLFVDGEPVGEIDMRGRRSDDPNDLFRHSNRREMRGLYVVMAWLGSWDTKDHQTLDAFITESEEDTLGSVKHYWIDLGASLGASADGPKEMAHGFEHFLDWEWIGRRFVLLGFASEPWRRAEQESGIPSVGNFASDGFDPGDFRALLPHPAFRARTDADSYWGAKLVASFSDEQIAAAIDAAEYEDERAKPYLLRVLAERRDQTARYWFDRVAPLDFLAIEEGRLRFRDLAVDRRLVAARAYEAVVASEDGRRSGRTIALASTELRLDALGGNASAVTLRIGVRGSGAKPVTVDLTKEAGSWRIRRIRHAE